MAQVELKKVEKKYGSTRIVHGVDLLVEDNEFIVLVGPSGCGKSTILRMIAGLESISGGEIHIGGQAVNEVAPKDRDVAMVFQNYALYPHMTVFENMAFSLQMAKMAKAEIQNKVEEAAAILELTPYLDRKPAALSGGQRQRVAMGRAIVRRPSVFLFDEPLSNLDAQLRTQMRMELKKLHMKMQTTTIYVTHDQVEAMTLADRIVILKNGTIQQVGSPVEVFERPANRFVAGFIGNPPVNILDGVIRKADGQSGVTVGQLFLATELPLSCNDGDRVLFGIRPDAIVTGGEVEVLPDGWQFDGTVSLAEIVGSQSIVEFEVGGCSLVAELAGRHTCQPGTVMRLGLDLNHMMLFDPERETALR